MKRLAIVPALLVALCAGCSDDDERRQKARSLADGIGLTVELPEGWHRADHSLTPHLSDPFEVLSVATFPLRYRPGECNNMPTSALEDLGPRDAFVSLQERHSGGEGFRPADFPARPERLDAAFAGEPSEFAECLSGPHRRVHWFTFSDGGRAFHTIVAFGDQAPPAVHDEAWRVLDSLRVRGRLAVGRGISAELPAGWQQAEESLTPHLTDPREVLSVGTFPMRHREAPCAQVPTAALMDLGARDAFVSLQERGVGGGERDFPPRPERFGPGLGTRSAGADCVRDGRFTEHWFGFADGGRRFHVRVALGHDASETTRDEAWRVLDSLRVEPRIRPHWESAG